MSTEQVALLAPPTVEDLLAAIQNCRAFISTQQIDAMTDNCRGGEGEWFKEKFFELDRQFNTMPKIYEQEGKGDEAIVQWHFFSGSADWYITERDTTRAQRQAYGLADLFGDGGELGYISVLELIRSNIDFDLHWTPVPLKDVLAKRKKPA